MTSRFGPFELDEQRWELRKNGRRVPIQRKALETILFLVRNRARVVTRGELRASLWPGTAVSDAAIAHAIMQARRALGPDRGRWIQSVRGRGVRFVGTVEESAAPAEPPASRGPQITSFEHQVLQCFHVLVGAVVEIARSVSPVVVPLDQPPRAAGQGEAALPELAHHLRPVPGFETAQGAPAAGEPDRAGSIVPVGVRKPQRMD